MNETRYAEPAEMDALIDAAVTYGEAIRVVVRQIYPGMDGVELERAVMTHCFSALTVESGGREAVKIGVHDLAHALGLAFGGLLVQFDPISRGTLMIALADGLKAAHVNMPEILKPAAGHG